MAVYDGAYIENDMECMFWIDPNRYRCTVWKQREGSQLFSVKVRTMVDKDKSRLQRRVSEFVRAGTDGR